MLTQERIQQISALRERGFANLKPWGSLLETSRLSFPTNSGIAASRLNHNLVFYQSNYLLVTLGLLFYVLLTNWFLTFSVLFIVLSLGWIGRMPQGQSSTFLGAQVTPTQAYGIVGILSIPLLWISGAGSAVFWIIGAASVLIGGHAACLEPPIESEFEQPV